MLRSPLWVKNLSLNHRFRFFEGIFGPNKHVIGMLNTYSQQSIHLNFGDQNDFLSNGWLEVWFRTKVWVWIALFELTGFRHDQKVSLSLKHLKILLYNSIWEGQRARIALKHTPIERYCFSEWKLCSPKKSSSEKICFYDVEKKLKKSEILKKSKNQ